MRNSTRHHPRTHAARSRGAKGSSRGGPGRTAPKALAAKGNGATAVHVEPTIRRAIRFVTDHPLPTLGAVAAGIGAYVLIDRLQD